MTTIPKNIQQSYGWLPPGWRLEKLKFFASVRNSNVDKTVTDDEVPVQLCNYTDVYYNDRITVDLEFMNGSATETEIVKFQLKHGQVIITKDSESWDDIGIPALVTEDMPGVLCGYHLSVLEPGEDLDGGFLAWLCRSEPLNDQFKLGANGVTRYGLGQYPLKNSYVAIPSLKTQQRIAQFLDKKTAQIDGLIEKKRTLLNRLAEKRQALITRAVTKGLDPNAPTKPSCIDWLGDIPAHWEVKRLRFLLVGGTINGLYKPKDQFSSNGVAFVQMGEAFKGAVFEGGTKDRVLASDGEIGKWGLQEGDFLIARRSLVFEGSGKSVKVGLLSEKHLFESSMIRIRPLHADRLSGFLSYYFQSTVCRAFFLSITKQVTISGVDSQQLKDIKIPMPPLVEAKKIYKECMESDDAHESVTTSIVNSIQQLEEYRSALITAAVTGQLEVS